MKIPLDSEETVKALLGTKPPPVGALGSRKFNPNPARKRKATKRKAAKKR